MKQQLNQTQYEVAAGCTKQHDDNTQLEAAARWRKTATDEAHR